MRLAVRIVLAAGLLLIAAALLARFVLHGPVSGSSLRDAVAEQSGSADPLDAAHAPCRRHGPSGAWICVVADVQSSGTAAYRVVVHRGSSCWDGRLVRHGEGQMPHAIHGCVHLWQWSLADALL